MIRLRIGKAPMVEELKVPPAPRATGADREVTDDFVEERFRLAMT
jgi:hypothetical protein